MTFEEHLAALRAQGQLFVAALSRVDAAATVPTCPEWTVRDLVHHQGEVHRWATAVVRVGAAKPSAELGDFRGPLPADDELAGWLTDGLDALTDTLGNADAGLAAFTFLADAPPPRSFWARRQAFETGMHRVDAESVTGAITPFTSALAADGIDEMLTGFAPRPRTPLHAESPVTLQVAPTDSPSRWHLTISRDAPVTARHEAEADCTVRGEASDIYLALWNRGDIDVLDVSGDASALVLFRDNVKVQWR